MGEFCSFKVDNKETCFTSSYSSINEDQIVASDAPFMDTDNYDAYEKLTKDTDYIPLITVQQSTLLYNISHYVIKEEDTPEAVIEMHLTSNTSVYHFFV